MKKLVYVIIMLLSITSIASVPAMANAQGGFLLGLGTGLLLGDGDKITGNNPNIIYTAPRIQERIKDPFAIKQISIYFEGQKGSVRWQDKQFLTLADLFQQALNENSKDKGKMKTESFEIIQVFRVFRGDGILNCGIWFVFIDKDKLIPLNELPLAK